MTLTTAKATTLATVLGAGVAVAFAATLLRDPPARELPPLVAPPPTLRETGLYGDWEARLVAPAHLPFTPQYPLWSDGAAKRRWIYIPPGAAIDARDPDAWQFPIGTRIWKEFSFGGARAETRFMLRAPDGWHYASYAWAADGREASRAPAAGAGSVEIAPGTRHRIPSEADCRACHATGPTPVLGFSALQLSPDRDPLAVHAEPPIGFALPELAGRGVIRGLPADLVAAPPRIPGSPVERAARGYLHGNCGGCHRDGSAIAGVGLVLAHSLRGHDAIARTALDHPSEFMAPRLRIASGAADRSVVLARMSARTPLHQMPPLGTRLVDTDAIRLVARWIDQLAPSPTQGATQ